MLFIKVINKFKLDFKLLYPSVTYFKQDKMNYVISLTNLSLNM